MGDKRATVILLSVALLVLASCFSVFHAVQANMTHFPYPEPAFTINSDGTIDPSTAPIRRSGDTYTLTDNIAGYTIIINRDNITLDGSGYTLRGLGYANVTRYMEHLNSGVYVVGRHGVTVRNMRISGFYDGIYVSIYFVDDRNRFAENRFEDNMVSNCHYGINVYSCLNVFRNNRMENNTCNFSVIDSVQGHPEPPNLYVNDVDASNTVDGKPIIYWIGRHGGTVPFNAGYVALVNCSNMNIQNLDLSRNGQGMLLIHTDDCIITKNNITSTDLAVSCFNCSNLMINENNLEGNLRCVDVYDSANINVSSNSMTQGRHGTDFIGSSVNNVAYDNDIKRPQEEETDALGVSPILVTASITVVVSAVVAVAAVVYLKKRRVVVKKS